MSSSKVLKDIPGPIQITSLQSCVCVCVCECVCI